jgi:hypothetical protein
MWVSGIGLNMFKGHPSNSNNSDAKGFHKNVSSIPGLTPPAAGLILQIFFYPDLKI